MGIDEFGLTLQSHIAGFISYWKYHQMCEGDDFPGELNEEEWYEQFIVWLEIKESLE